MTYLQASINPGRDEHGVCNGCGGLHTQHGDSCISLRTRAVRCCFILNALIGGASHCPEVATALSWEGRPRCKEHQPSDAQTTTTAPRPRG